MSISLQSLCSQSDALSSPVIGNSNKNTGVEIDLKNLRYPCQFTEIELSTLDFEKFCAYNQTQTDSNKQYPIKIRRKYCPPTKPLVFKPFSSMDQLELTVASLNKFLSSHSHVNTSDQNSSSEKSN